MIAQEALGHPVSGFVEGVFKREEGIVVLSQIFGMNQHKEYMIQVKSIIPGLVCTLV